MKTGLFVGLTTLDLIYLADSSPKSNEKLVADDYTVAAGGPATNAAIAFNYLGFSYLGKELDKQNLNENSENCTNIAKLCTVIGSHPMTYLIHGDLNHYQVEIIDLKESNSNPPPVSSIIITKTTGERAVISINAVKTPASENDIPSDILQGVDIVLIDGHQMELGYAIAKLAKVAKIPIVIDGGSWKEGFENVLPLADYVICSANFYPPLCKTSKSVFEYLSSLNVPYVAITHGDKPIEYQVNSQRNNSLTNTINCADVPRIDCIDTLGAGDIFHGAFCHYILHESFEKTLLLSAKVASYSCQFFGTRRWMSSSKDGVN